MESATCETQTSRWPVWLYSGYIICCIIHLDQLVVRTVDHWLRDILVHEEEEREREAEHHPGQDYFQVKLGCIRQVEHLVYLQYNHIITTVSATTWQGRYPRNQGGKQRLSGKVSAIFLKCQCESYNMYLCQYVGWLSWLHICNYVVIVVWSPSVFGLSATLSIGTLNKNRLLESWESSFY